MIDGQTIYVVVSGEYPNYRIDGVFSDKLLAEEFKLRLHCDDIDEWPLNPMRQELANNRIRYRVQIHRNGDIGFVNVEYGKYALPVGIIYPFDDYHGPIPAFIIINVVARNEQHAIEIANEKRVQMIAEGLWPED